MTSNQIKVCVLFSGGLDSTAAADYLRQSGHNVVLLHIQYGQASAGEEAAAVAKLKSLFGGELKVIHLSDETPKGAGMILGRNAFLISTAVMVMRGAVDAIATGIHDGPSYYDCSPQFLKLMKRLIEEATDGQQTLLTPFLEWPKSAIVSYCERRRIPVELTYSCENGTNPPCGHCLSCKDRMACNK